jgi:hypothetical protein
MINKPRHNGVDQPTTTIRLWVCWFESLETSPWDTKSNREWKLKVAVMVDKNNTATTNNSNNCSEQELHLKLIS